MDRLARVFVERVDEAVEAQPMVEPGVLVPETGRLPIAVELILLDAQQRIQDERDGAGAVLPGNAVEDDRVVIGDGKIFVYDVENVVKVRTGEEGYDALQDVE